MVSITLPDDIEAWARREVAEGRAASVEQWAESALRDRRMFDAHKPLVEEAYRQMENGEFVEEAEMDAIFDTWLAEDLKK